MTNAESSRPLQDAVLPPTSWRKSSYSGGTGGSCVEVATAPDVSAVRDTRHRHLGYLEFPIAEWAAFLTAARREAL
ncbi:DUF397 domain-containing protein [Thermobifida halotolerans]|uniref:DUF397 domain-containing protein n=1 Tax=Thermobifida halotolerans TaxID=483545 RepID=A0A399G0T5_9ACTN|nr:DUF397 domain-containing protein [Thermobifida halotolerans]UOE19482.1 DUF397 domain-containing protein [Thermobifida halotolerans]